MTSKLLLGGEIKVHDWNVEILGAKAFQIKNYRYLKHLHVL